MTIVEFLNTHTSYPPMCKLVAKFIDKIDDIFAIKHDICWITADYKINSKGNTYRSFPEEKFKSFSDLYKDKKAVSFQVAFETLTPIEPIKYYGDTLEIERLDNGKV